MKIKYTPIASIALLFSSLFGLLISSASVNKAIGADANAICQGIANDENNNIAETVAQQNPVPRYRTLLKYDVSLGESANTTNVVSTTGQGITLNGVPLSNIPNALVDYANGSKYLRIKIPQTYQDALTGTVFLEVKEGTIFESKVLDGAKFALSGGKWRTVSKVSYTEIVWNDTGYNFYVDMKGVLLRFSANLSKLQSQIDGGIQSTNFASTVGSTIYLGGVRLSTLPGAFVSYHSTNLLFIYCENMPAYRTLKIEDDTCILDSLLPEVNLTFNATDKWTEKEKTYSDVTFTGIRWNNKGYDFYKNMKGLLLDFSANISKRQNEIDAGIQSVDFSQVIGDHILLGNKKISTLPGAFISYHSQNMLFFYCTNMTSYRTFKIEAGVKVLDSSLPELTLYYTTSSEWSLEPEPLTQLSFSNIFWNNVGYDVYTGKNGLMLSYSSNISNAENEINGALKLTNYVKAEIGEKITLDGTPLKNVKDAEVMYFGSTFLWIYAPKMNMYKELNIESVEFLTSQLPSTRFAFFESEWDEVFQVKNVINGVERVDYYRKNNKLVLGENYYSKLLGNEGLSLKIISFKVNGTTYGMGDTLEVKEDVTVEVNAVGFETSKGASIRISEVSNIRFESKIDKNSFDYIKTLYGESNIETGTYIIPKTSLNLASLSQFFADETKIEGIDYVKVENDDYILSSDTLLNKHYKYYGSLQGVFANDYCTEYCGVGYIKIKNGSNVYTLYGASKQELVSRSVYDVIQRSFKDYSMGSSKHNILSSYLNGILSLVSGNEHLEIENPVDGYQSPYTLNFDSSTGEYTVAGPSKIITVLFNGEERIATGNIVMIGESIYKVENYDLKVGNDSSVLKFNLTNIAKASNLVDFVVNMPVDREMKILQLTDTQIIDSSQMRNPSRLGPSAVEAYSRGKIDQNCFNHISSLIEKERPDLILFTGDIVYGEFDDSGEIWIKMVEFMDSFGIPWAPIFGNHDNETNMGVGWQCQQLENAKNCLFKERNLTGHGNYSIGLVDSNGKIRRVIYMFDSNGCIKGAGIAQDQLNWMNSVASSIDNTYGEKIPAFACYHIPSKDFVTAFQEKYHYEQTDSFNLDKTGVKGDFGQKNEKVSLFDVSIVTNLKGANVDGVFAGHDHVNNFSILYDGIRYTYGTKTGIYDYYRSEILGGTLIRLGLNGAFEVSHSYLSASEMNNKVSSSTNVTVLSDLHNDTKDYGGFHCTKTKTKLRKLVNETQSSKFYINLGDTVNSCDGSLNTYYDIINVMKSLNLNVYNSQQSGYSSSNRMMYNLLGNHEAAYAKKSAFKDYSPYVEGIGSSAVFTYEDIMFVAVDALFTRDGSDDPSDIITCTEFMIPDNEINWLQNEVEAKIEENTKGIVWISHVALKDIDDTSKGKLLSYLKNYNLPMTVFEGHTHIEAYQELIDEKTGLKYCEVYTLPAVVLNDTYPYYNVTFKDGKVWCIDKHLTGEVK